METLQPFFHKDSGAFWCGKLRAGVTGITAVCLELDDPESDFIQDRPKITVARAGGFFVKRYNLPGFFTQLRRLFKTSRLQTVLRGAEHLNKLGIPTPSVVAILTEYRGVRRREYLVTELFKEGEKVLNLVIHQSSDRESIRQQLLSEFLPQLAALHDSGALHGDLNMRNLYLDKSGMIGMIDLDGMRLTGQPLKAALRARELARFASGFLLCCRKWDETEDFTEQVLQNYSKYAVVTPSLEETLPLTQKFIDRSRKHYEY